MHQEAHPPSTPSDNLQLPAAVQREKLPGYQSNLSGIGPAKRAVALFSGGLDSCLAVRIVQLQGFEVEALFVETVFERCRPEVYRAAEALGVPLTIVPPREEYVQILKSPRFGYGRGANPCVDCRIYMCRVAKEFLEKSGACMLVTGEVLGQRPMSQERSRLFTVEKHSGLKGRILRPLSAQRLPPTLPELEGLVDRSKLFGFTGRGRSLLIALAKSLGLTVIPQPSVGCVLTQPSFAPRVWDLIRHRPEAGMWEFDLLRVGRHFRASPQAKFVVGRNAEENAFLEKTFRDHPCPEAALCCPGNFPGPFVLVVGTISNETLEIGSDLVIRYTRSAKLPPEAFVRVHYQGGEEIRPVAPRGHAVELPML
jgi:hypothetical protein